MASPRAVLSKINCISPQAVRDSLKISKLLNARTPKRKDNAEIEKNRLSPFNIDTPNRLRILRDGLPQKHYTVLGSGSFGTVYKARYKGCEVAAKIMQKKKGTDAAVDSEKHAARLRHCNIVRVLNIEEGTAVSLITMELCGPTLHDLLEETSLTGDRRVRIWTDIAQALQFCHDSNVIHADVKPKNVLIATNGQPKLTDFGSSIVMNEPCISKELHGTPGYAAPEVLQGNIPCPAADIYSLGILAWQMLSRKLPFSGLHAHTVIYLSAKGKRPADKYLDDRFSGKYKKLYRQMWSQEISARPTLNDIINNLRTLAN